MSARIMQSLVADGPGVYDLVTHLQENDIIVEAVMYSMPNQPTPFIQNIGIPTFNAGAGSNYPGQTGGYYISCNVTHISHTYDGLTQITVAADEGYHGTLYFALIRGGDIYGSGTAGNHLSMIPLPWPYHCQAELAPHSATSAVFPTTSTGIAFAGVCVGEDIGILDEQCQDGGTGNATAVLGAWVVMGDQKSKFGYAGATNKATATVRGGQANSKFASGFIVFIADADSSDGRDYHSSQATIRGNQIDDCQGAGISLLDCEDVQAHDNTLRNCDSGITANTATTLAVDSNNVSNCQNPAVHLVAVRHGHIADNLFMACSQATDTHLPPATIMAGTNVHLASNKFTPGPVDSAVHEYSVLVDAASQGVGIQSNDFRGCFTQDEPIEDYGVDTAIGINLPMGTIGTGDMRKSVYDMDDDGTVDAAETAPWDGITGKPATFPPADHTHDPSDIIGLGANTYATDIGNGSATEYTVTHNLNRLDLLIQARRNVPPRNYVTPTVEILTSNTVKLTFDVAPAAGAIRAIFTGIGPETTPPVVAFTFAPPSGLAPLSVTFTDASTGIIDAWAWDFGDGNTSTARNPSHTYTLPGQYTPALAVTGPTGSGTFVNDIPVFVQEPENRTALREGMETTISTDATTISSGDHFESLVS